MRIRRRSIYFRLALVFMLLVGIVGFAQLLILVWGVRDLAARIEQQTSWNIATAIRDRVQTSVYPAFNEEETSRKLYEFSQLNPGVSISVLDASGKALVVAPPPLNPKIPGAVPELAPVDVGPLKTALSITNPVLPVWGQPPFRSGTEDADVLFSVAPIELPDGQGYVYVVLNLYSGFTISRVGQFALLRVVLAGSAVVLLLSAALGYIAFLLVTRRFRVATSMLQEFANGSYGSRLHDTNPDELGDMARAIDKMADAVVASEQQLIERDRLRRDLVANITHDLRNPVAAMRARLELLLEGNQQTQFADELKSLMRSTELQQRLVLDLFELSKLEAEQSSVMDAIDLKPIVSVVAERIKPIAARNRVTLELELAKGGEVLGDAALIERALANLVENAIRYAPPDTSIAIRLAERGNGMEVQVQDHGRGIAPEQSAELFERTVRSADSPGAGLGLAIVKKIIELHHGKLSVESAEGKGATMKFWLPFADE